ncbi:hypothetical protein Dimus_026238 [Dionaea muscipula]
MAAGLERDHIVILRIDGEDLKDFITSQTFETEMVSLFSQIESSPDAAALGLGEYITKALEKLGADQGLPPTSDSWVMSQVVEPAMIQACSNQLQHDQLPVTQDQFLKQFKNVAENIVGRLKEQPVIVAHTQKTFEGSSIRRLLANKFELEKAINGAIETLPRDQHGQLSKEYLRVALHSLAPSAGLPAYGAVHQVDRVTDNVLKMVDADGGKLLQVKEEELKKLLTEALANIMLQLEGNPISVSYNSVVHEALASVS